MWLSYWFSYFQYFKLHRVGLLAFQELVGLAGALVISFPNERSWAPGKGQGKFHQGFCREDNWFESIALLWHQMALPLTCIAFLQNLSLASTLDVI